MKFDITPTTANLIVLTSSGHGDASVVWLVDDQNYCAARMGTNAKGELEGPQGICGRLADLAKDSPGHTPLPMVAYGDLPIDDFEVWMDQPEDIVLVGDDSHVYGPVHQRRIQLTTGHTATIVEYRTNATSDEPHWETGPPRLCTASMSLCRSVF